MCVVGIGFIMQSSHVLQARRTFVVLCRRRSDEDYSNYGCIYGPQTCFHRDSPRVRICLLGMCPRPRGDGRVSRTSRILNQNVQRQYPPFVPFVERALNALCATPHPGHTYSEAAGNLGFANKRRWPLIRDKVEIASFIGWVGPVVINPLRMAIPEYTTRIWWAEICLQTVFILAPIIVLLRVIRKTPDRRHPNPERKSILA
jgi:hypothetical protein